jgi:thiamine transport system substrate-binding protein
MNRSTSRRLGVMAAVALTGTAVACGGGTEPEPTTITLVTYSSFPVEGTGVNAALDEFAAANGLTVEILTAGDTGTMITKAALTAGNPEGDVMWGVDTTLLGRAVEAGIFEPHVASDADAIPDRFRALVVDDLVTPVDFGDVCVNVDLGWFADNSLAPPTTLEDLAEERYAGLLAVQDPTSSSPGLAFLLATIARFGDGWEDYWTRLVANDVLVTDDWEAAYYGAFTRAGGDRPLVVSYGSSPPYEVLFDPTVTEPPTGVVTDTCYRQVEFAGVLRGTDSPTGARALVDFLISPEFQRHVATDLYVFPVRRGVDLDPVFVEHAVIPESPAELDAATIDAGRATWTERWLEIAGG